MHHTIFDTPVVNSLLRGISVGLLKLGGWKLRGKLPEGAERCVVIAAPHTSNWDLPYTLMAAFALRMRIYWMGKASIFKRPFGPVMRWLGGIAVDRSKSNNLVEASTQALREASGKLQLVLSPEGTRAKVREWRTGFYWIALKAEVPIVLAYLDFKNKVAGIGPLFHPTGDIERDMAEIRAFYAPFEGKRALQFDAG